MAILTDRPKITNRQLIISGALILTGLAIGIFSSWMSSSGERLLGITILVFGAVTLGPILMDMLRYRLDPFEARNVFVLFFALYTLPLPVLIYLQRTPVTLTFDIDVIIQALLLSLLGLVCFYSGYRIRLGEIIAQRLPLFGAESQRRLLCSAAFLLLVSLMLILLLLSAIGGLWAYLGSGYMGLYKLEAGLEHFSVGFNLLSTTVLLLYYLAHRRRTRASMALLISTLIGLSILFLVVGRRRYLFTMIFALLAYRHYGVRMFSFKQLVLLGIVGFTLMSLWGNLRGIPAEQLLTKQSWMTLRQVSLSDLFYVVTGAGEFTGSGAWLPQVMEYISNGEWHYLLGMSYLQAPIIFIPRLLYPGRPPTLSEWYVSTYYPDIAAQAGGLGFFFLAEAYWNFGVGGIFLLMLIAGVVFRTAYSYLKTSGYEPRVALLYAAFISWIPSALRIDFAIAFKGFVEFVFLILLFALLYSSGWRLRVRR